MISIQKTTIIFFFFILNTTILFIIRLFHLHVYVIIFSANILLQLYFNVTINADDTDYFFVVIHLFTNHYKIVMII